MLAQRIEENGAPRFAMDVVRNSQRTSSRGGILKAKATVLFAKALVEHGVEYFQDIPAYEEGSDLAVALRAVHGQGSGISTGYFWMLAGTDRLVKPDRMIVGFLSDTLQRSVTVQEAQRLLAEASDVLADDFPHLTPRLLDYEVWQFQRARIKPRAGGAVEESRVPSDREAVRPGRISPGEIAVANLPLSGSSGVTEESVKRQAAVTGMTPIGLALERAGRELQGRYAPNPIPTRELATLAASYADRSPSSVLPADFAYDRVNKGRRLSGASNVHRRRSRPLEICGPRIPIHGLHLLETDRRKGATGRVLDRRARGFTYDPRGRG